MKTKYEYKREFIPDLKHLRELEKAGYSEIMIAKYYGVHRQTLWRMRERTNRKRKYAKNNKI